MQEAEDIQQDGGKVDGALGSVEELPWGHHEIEFRVEVFHHPDHEPKHVQSEGI